MKLLTLEKQGRRSAKYCRAAVGANFEVAPWRQIAPPAAPQATGR
jgi:hypothetical protein